MEVSVVRDESWPHLSKDQRRQKSDEYSILLRLLALAAASQHARNDVLLKKRSQEFKN